MSNNDLITHCIPPEEREREREEECKTLARFEPLAYAFDVSRPVASV